MKKVLMFPGAFNPPHYGHTKALEAALAHTEFDEVWIVPSGNRKDKDIVTQYEDRRNLGRLFVEYLGSRTDVPVKLLTDELDDTEGRFTHEILKDIRTRPGARVVQLIGVDGFLSIKDKASEDEVFVVVGRAGYEMPDGLDIGENIFVPDDGSTEEISSTKIRKMVQEGDRGYRDLLPESIADYIEAHGLYM